LILDAYLNNSINVNDSINENDSVESNDNIDESESINVNDSTDRESRLLPDGSINPNYEGFLYGYIMDSRGAGMSWSEVTDRLNADGILTLRGKQWGRGNAPTYCKRYEKRESA